MQGSKKNWGISENDVTPEHIYKNRREVLKKLGFTLASLPIATNAQAGVLNFFSQDKEATDKRILLSAVKSEKYQPSLALTPEKKVITYNNFYEFGTNKSDPAMKSANFISDPWNVVIDGLVNNPIELNYDDILKKFTLEERIYRFRCVEAWSMNIPWIGFPLAELIKLAQPKFDAKYVFFQTLFDPEQFPAQKSHTTFGFPYVEGLRLDEAMHPLTLISVGLYGKTLAPQNGAPLRLIVPWKYGFKQIKSIVRIHFTSQQPQTSWNKLSPREYGFYANVNPNVDHPRWSQASERFIGGEGLFDTTRQPTLMFNGYEKEVASLYKNMDLRKFY